MTSSNAARASSRSSDSPAASFRIASWSAELVVLTDTQRLDEPFGKTRVRRDERDHEAQEAHALDVLVDEHTLQHAVREIHDAEKLVVIDEREADERSAREVLVLEQRMLPRFGDVLHQERLAIRGDLARHAMPDADPRAFRDVRRDALGGGDIEHPLLRRAQQQRAALRMHVVADEREESVRQLAGIVGGVVQREHTIDEVQRARALAQLLAATVQLDVRLLELLDGAADRGLDSIEPFLCATRVLDGMRQ